MSEPPKSWNKRVKDLMLSHTEACIMNNFKWTWANLQKYLDEKNRREQRTKEGNYEEVENDKKLLWANLFSEHQLEECKKFLYKYFRYGTSLKYWDEIIIETEESREEFGKIIYEVAQQHGFDYNQEIDKFLNLINGYMSKLCPQTFIVLKQIPSYWSLLSYEDLSQLAYYFNFQELPYEFLGTREIKETILKIFLKEINSDRHDHELSQGQKDAISEAIFRDVQYQNLKFENICTNSNPYLVLYNTHPSLRKS